MLEVFEILQKAVKPGNKISDVHKACIQYGKDKVLAEGSSTEAGKKYQSFTRGLPKIIGYGIGMNFKEELLSIKDDNDRVIEPGMVFNIRLSLTNFAKPGKEPVPAQAATTPHSSIDPFSV